MAGVGMGHDAKTAVFLGAALTATSVGITARVFGDLRALATTEARIVIGAAVADDVLGLVILTVVVKVVTGEPSASVSSPARSGWRSSSSSPPAWSVCSSCRDCSTHCIVSRARAPQSSLRLWS